MDITFGRCVCAAMLPVLFALSLPPAAAAEGENEDENWIALNDSTWVRLYEVDPVVVTGSRTEQRLADVTIATELITREDLSRSGSPDLADFLGKQSGLAVSQTIFGSGVQLQGLGSEYVLILVDGERTLGRKAGVIDLSRFSTDNIERIEVVKGNQSALYGADAIGGVINIITRGSREALEFDLRGNAAPDGELDLGASLGSRGERWTTRFTGSYDQADPYDIEPDDPETSVDGYDSFSVANNSELELGERSELKARANYLSRDQRGVDGGTSPSSAIFDRQNSTEIFSVSLGPDVRFEGGHRLQGSVQFSYYLDQYLQDQRGSSNLDTYEETRQRLVHGSLQADRLLPARHLLSAGVEAFQEWIEADRLEEGESERKRLGVFLQDQWQVDEDGGLKFVAGLRLDSDSQFGDHLTPKLNVRKNLGSQIILRGGVGLGFRAPDFKELYVYFAHPAVGYVVYGNPDLEPERSVSGNLGLEWDSGRGYWLGISAFHHEFENLIQGIITDEVVGGLNKAVYVNVNQATVRGVEVTFRYRPFAVLDTEFGYAFLDSRDDETGGILDGRPRHRGTVSLDWQLPKLRADLLLRGSLVGERAFTQETSGVATEKADPYALLDLTLRKKLGKRLGLSLGMRNITDAGDHDYLRVSPRRVFAGFQLSHSGR